MCFSCKVQCTDSGWDPPPTATPPHNRQTISWMTSSRHIAHVFSAKAATNHELYRCIRTRLDWRAAAAMSPPQLAHEILRALQKQLGEECPDHVWHGRRVSSMARIVDRPHRGNGLQMGSASCALFAGHEQRSLSLLIAARREMEKSEALLSTKFEILQPAATPRERVDDKEPGQDRDHTGVATVKQV